MSEDQFLSVQEACDILGLSTRSTGKHTAGNGRQTVYGYIKSGQLAATNFGGSAGYRIRASELDRFIAERESDTRRRMLRDRVRKEVDAAANHP